MSEEKEFTLDDLFIGRNVTTIDKKDDMNLGKDGVLFVGANYCGHSQIGASAYESACSVLKEEGRDLDCYSLDVNKKGGGDIAKGLKLPPVGGVPALLKWSANDEKWETIAKGRRTSPQYLETLENNNSGGI